MHEFTAELWVWEGRRSDTWTFVTLPGPVSESVSDEAHSNGPRAGFGTVRVRVQVGATSWQTSVFPDKGRGAFVLPIKAAVRRAQDLAVGDSVHVLLEVEAGSAR
jgi:hypothetical protein